MSPKLCAKVRLGLLEADVNFKVVKDFIGRIRERAVGGEILEGLHPAQQVIKIVDEELTALLGGEQAPLTFRLRPPTVIMLCGLQGAGKTTHAGKLALMLRKQGRNPMLVAADIYRPAAIKQLQVVGEQVKTPVFTLDGAKPEIIARDGVAEADRKGYDVVILDTAGRLQIDESLMAELQRVKAAVAPHEILLVVDAMTGQEAVAVAQGFNEALDVTGFILTKLDGDTRGGAALSIKSVVGRPHQVCRRRRKDGRAGSVPPGPHGVAHSGHGRRADADRAGRRGAGPEKKRRSWKRSSGPTSLTLKTIWTRCGRCEKWGRWTRYSK